ncbi:MAG TPA: polysaccharide pyruvyl transferase family protein [Solirubrobacteraceae bacterium]
MTEPRITIGIPTFDRAEWLGETIESVLSQSYADFRLIVSDNASQDSTPEVMRSFDDHRIEYLRSERNVGAIGNLNRLIDLAETEFLLLLPDDDLLYPGHLRACVDVLDRFETAGLVHSAYDELDGDSRPVRRVHPVASRAPVLIESRDRAIERLMGAPSWLCFASIVYRTEAIKRAGGLHPGDEPFGDRKLWMRMALDWDFGYVARPLVGVRAHASNITSRIAIREDGSAASDRERARLYSEATLRQRTRLIDEAGLAPGRATQLRALATLQYLVESASTGPTSAEVAARLAKLVRAYPSIVFRSAFWHLVVAQGGGRRVRSALRARSARWRSRTKGGRRVVDERTFAMPHKRNFPKKVTLFGHFGSLNSGNESSMRTMLSHLREASPDTQFLCVCTHPEAVVARDGIEASPITTRSRASRLPLVGRPYAALREILQCIRAFKVLEGTDALIIPGTGLVTDAFGLHAWGPYNVFKWVLVAKLRRARILLVSIGAGPFYSPVGKALVKATLSLADYRSYRDEASRESVCEIGFPAQRDPVYPDLVFSLPQALMPSQPAQTERERPVVGIGLMAYPGRYSATDPQADTYTTYLESMASFAAWLLDAGYDIRLLFGDGDGDLEVVEELKHRLRARLGSYDETRVVEQPPTSQDVLTELAQTDLVVATRFHNVLLSLLLNKPVIAITFHHKCSSLMEQMKLSEYCQDIHHIDVDRLVGQLQHLERNRDAVTQTIAEGVHAARAALDEQYELLFQGA